MRLFHQNSAVPPAPHPPLSCLLLRAFPSSLLLAAARLTLLSLACCCSLPPPLSFLLLLPAALAAGKRSVTVDPRSCAHNMPPLQVAELQSSLDTLRVKYQKAVACQEELELAKVRDYKRALRL